MEAVWQAVGKPHPRNLFKRLSVQHKHIATAMNIAHNRYDNSYPDQIRYKNYLPVFKKTKLIKERQHKLIAQKKKEHKLSNVFR